MRIFYDTVHDEFISLEYLREVYNEFASNDYTFPEYIAACQTRNDGTLTEYRNNGGREYVLRYSGSRFTKDEAIAWLENAFSWSDEVDLSKELENQFNHFDECKVKSDRDF